MVDYEHMTSDEILDCIFKDFEESEPDGILEDLFNGEHNEEAMLEYMEFMTLLFSELRAEEKPEYVEKTMVLLTKFICKFARSKGFPATEFEKCLDTYLTALSACVEDYASVFPKIQPYLKSLFMTTQMSQTEEN